MTLEALFLVVVPTYLVLVAYGQIGARRRGLGTRARFMAAALRVILPPAALILALWSTGDAVLLAIWSGVIAAMTLAGAIVAGLAEVIARRVGA